MTVCRLLWLQRMRLQPTGAVVVMQRLAVLRHMGTSRTRNRTRVLCTGRRVLAHCTTRGQRLFLGSHLPFLVEVWIKVSVCMSSLACPAMTRVGLLAQPFLIFTASSGLGAPDVNNLDSGVTESPLSLTRCGDKPSRWISVLERCELESFETAFLSLGEDSELQGVFGAGVCFSWFLCRNCHENCL